MLPLAEVKEGSFPIQRGSFPSGGGGLTPISLYSEHLQGRTGWEKGMLFTAGTALAKRNQMLLLLLGWVVLARRGLLFQCQ